MKYILKNISLALLILTILSGGVMGQVPIPAKPQSTPLLLKGATLHIGNGQVIENGVIGFAEGKITTVGQSASGINEADYTVIDVAGKHIYPGFILPNTQLGISEVSSVRAMSDQAETGDFNPNVRSIIAYNTDSENIPAFRFNGILLAEPTPVGGIISGTSTIVELDAWNWEDAAHTTDVAIHMNWPGRLRGNFDYATYTFSYVKNEKYDEAVQGIEKLFNDVKAYRESPSKIKNLKLESMLGLFDGTKALILHSDMAKGVVESVKFAQAQGVKRIAVVSGQDVVVVADFLAENKIPVIVPALHDTPNRADYDYDIAYKLASVLSAKGIKVSLSHTGMLGNSRNLPFYAGTAVAHGMSKEDALKMITSNTAELFGIQDRVGTLEKGKDATLIVSEGDALDMRTNILSHAFIRGKQITLEGRQQMLFKKYSEKYGHSK